MDRDWIEHPDLASLDLAKLQLLQSLALRGAANDNQNLMPFLMMAMQQAKKSGMTFTPEEMELVVKALKSSCSSKDSARIDRMLTMLKSIKK